MRKILIALTALCMVGSVFAAERTDEEIEDMYIRNAIEASRILMEAEK